ncbi:MAG: hypothetical protein HDS53_04815 [Barnesiella sp.]|nr:hypothetical protein [Barnesiella sp.]
MNTKCNARKKEMGEGINPADLPGVSIDKADDETVDKSLVKERTETLNNNPRDTDNIDM